MARHCSLTGKTVMFGQNRSHAENKTKRRFNPNLQYKHMYSDALGTSVRLRMSMNAVRTVEKNGGLDAYLLGADEELLDKHAVALKRRVAAARAKAAA